MPTPHFKQNLYSSFLQLEVAVPEHSVEVKQVERRVIRSQTDMKVTCGQQECKTPLNVQLQHPWHSVPAFTIKSQVTKTHQPFGLISRQQEGENENC